MPAQEWIPVPDVAEQIDELLLDDLDLISELTHPLRSRIVHQLRHPHSVAELAAALEVPVTRLYHHIRRLEEIGMISVVATRQAGARTEHRFRNVAVDYRIDDRVMTSSDPDTFARTVGSLFDIARTQFQREVEVGALSPESVHGRATVVFNEYTFDQQRRGEFLERLHALMEEYAPTGETTDEATATDDRWRLFIAGFPLTD
ncbi:MAG TPA: helix-turn-helix domain-containing protein [Ilumatobacter sp.]|nr:helix-turn-helix domain-containing protein [Ilumatobacter sp.]